MLRCQLTARVLLIDVGTIRDTNQCIMRFIHRRLREIDVVGGDQWNALGVGHFDEPSLGQALCLGQATILRMTLEFNVKPIPKCALHLIHERFRRRALPALQQLANCALRSAGETD